MKIEHPHILFDLDGTLLDSSECAVRATQEAFAAGGLAAPTRDEIVHMMGIPIESSFVGFMGDRFTAEMLRALIQDFRQRYRMHSATLVSAFDGVGELMADLCAAGRRIAIVSSKKSDVIRSNLLSCQIAAYIDQIVGSDDVRHYKPHPEPVKKAMQGFGCMDPAQFAMIGDAIHDIEMAVNAGVLGAGVGWGAHDWKDLLRAGATCVFENMGQLREALL